MFRFTTFTRRAFNTSLVACLAGTTLLGLAACSGAWPQGNDPFAPVPADGPHASEINEFIAADRNAMPPKDAVLFVGSSSIKFWDTLAKDFAEIPVINRGFGGSIIEESTRYADRIVVPYKPKLIVLCAGTNDLAYGGKSPQSAFEDYKAFVAKVHATLPNARVVYLTVNPTVARWKQEPKNLELNFLIARYVVETDSPTQKLTVIDPHNDLLTPDGKPQPKLLRADGLHFNA